MLHKEVHAVFFGRNRIRIGVRDLLQDLHIHNVKFVPARGTLIGPHFPLDDHTRFLGEALHGIKDFGCYRVLGHHTLNRAGTVAKNGEEQFPALALVVQPAADGNGLAFVFSDFGDGAYRSGHHFQFSIFNCQFSRARNMCAKLAIENWNANHAFLFQCRCVA